LGEKKLHRRIPGKTGFVFSVFCGVFCLVLGVQSIIYSSEAKSSQPVLQTQSDSVSKSPDSTVSAQPIPDSAIASMQELLAYAKNDLNHSVEGVFQKIAQHQAPYVDSLDPAKYIWIYDTNTVIVAHPRTELIGTSFGNKPDVRGFRFRDAIIKEALQNGSGWVSYSYEKPGELGVFIKYTYFELWENSSGLKYIVCTGYYP